MFKMVITFDFNEWFDSSQSPNKFPDYLMSLFLHWTIIYLTPFIEMFEYVAVRIVSSVNLGGGTPYQLRLGLCSRD